jgi:hypothetical protein
MQKGENYKTFDKLFGILLQYVKKVAIKTKKLLSSEVSFFQRHL